jgi:hypothetical protein
MIWFFAQHSAYMALVNAAPSFTRSANAGLQSHATMLLMFGILYLLLNTVLIALGAKQLKTLKSSCQNQGTGV